MEGYDINNQKILQIHAKIGILDGVSIGTSVSNGTSTNQHHQRCTDVRNGLLF